MEHFHCNTEAHSSQRMCTIAVVDILQRSMIFYMISWSTHFVTFPYMDATTLPLDKF